MATKNYKIIGRLTDSKTGSPVPGLGVQAWDKDIFSDDFLGEAISDPNGAFVIEFQRWQFMDLFFDLSPDLYFRILDGDTLIQSTENSVLRNVKAGELTVQVLVDIPEIIPSPKPPPVPVPAPAPVAGGRIPVLEVTKALGLAPDIAEELTQRKIAAVKDLFSVQGLLALKELGMPSAGQKQFLAAAKFTAASGSAALGSRLAKKGMISLAELGRMPLQRVNTLLGQTTDIEELALAKAYATGQMIGKLTVEQGVRSGKLWSRDSPWYADDSLVASFPGIERPFGSGVDLCADVPGSCNVFSPFAYLFDLLGFVFDHWNLPTYALEGIFHQKIDDIDCINGYKPVPQVRLALSVLEEYLGPGHLPSNDVIWVEAYKNTFANLIVIAGLQRVNLSIAAAADIASPAPDLATLDRAVQAVLDEQSVKSDKDYPLPHEPTATGATEEAQNEYLARKSAVDQQRINAKQEFEVQMANALATLLVLYREKLIQKTAKSVQWLERNLFIDLRNTPTLLTNRITQLIESIQALVLEVRIGGIVNPERPELMPLAQDLGHFDDETWNWLGNYSTWSAAMYALIYPENLIGLPLFRPSKTWGFAQTLEPLASSATRQSMTLAVQQYDEHLDVIGRSNRFSLKPIGAHVIDETLYLFATQDEREMWMNTASLPAQDWSGWRRVSEAKENLTPWQTALFQEDAGVSIVAAYWEYTSGLLRVFRLSSESLKDELPAPYTKIDVSQ